MAVRPEYFMAANGESPFYGAPQTIAEKAGLTEEPLQSEALPAGWLRQVWGVWEGWTPRDWQPRLQGWKIHISSIVADAQETLARVTRICVEHQVSFKFLPTKPGLIDANGKQGDRGSSGKFITIYPNDDAQLAVLLEALENTLKGQRGPFILSDLRYRDAPVYVRYGGIMAINSQDDSDQPVASIVAGPAHTFVPDERAPRFVLPEGVALPECLEASYARSRETTDSRLKAFASIKPLHFSNAGGVYKATLPDGTIRVLREARPHTGLDGRERDAVTRQEEEEQTLRELQGLPGVQQLVGSFHAWEHRFLELEYVEGVTLTSWIVLNSVLQTADDREAYAARVKHIARQFIDAVEGIHQRGWCLGDLHTGNVIVGPNDEVTILDLEDATRIDAPREVGFRVFEFCAPEEFTAEQADWYAVSRSIMMMYAADWELEVIAPDFWQRSMDLVEDQFGSESREQIESVLARFPRAEAHLLSPKITVSSPADPIPAAEAIDRLDAGIEWSRQFSAVGSFPGDVPQPGTNGAEVLGTGRAGVILARGRLERPVPERDIEMLEATAAKWGSEELPGLYNGLAGLGLTLSEIGRHDHAVAALRHALHMAQSRKRLDLFGGAAGVVTTAIGVAQAAGDGDLLEFALAEYERLHRTVDIPSAWASLTKRRGLLFGLSGIAVADLVAHLATDDSHYLSRAIDRVRAEVDACFVNSTGEMMVRDVENNRAMPYVEWGSAGVWLATMLAERVSGQPLLTPLERAGFAKACDSDFYIYSTLDHGRAGIVATLAVAGPEFELQASEQEAFLRATLMERESMAFVVGDGLIRLSSDYSTGAAGVALTLHSRLRQRPLDWMPLSKHLVDQISDLPIPDPDVTGLVADDAVALSGTGGEA